MNENNSDDLQLASLRSRGVAFVIDDLLITIIVLAIFWDSIMAASYDVNQMMALMSTNLVMPLIILKVIYQAVFTWYYGASVGKIIMKIRVIDSSSWQRVSLSSAILRSIGRIFSETFFYIGFLIAFFNDGRKSFHDITGKTLVVNA